MLIDSEIETTLNRWLDVAKWAPSGGNAQNWHATILSREDSIVVRIALLDASGESWSLMDVEGMASIVALGSFGFSLTAAAANDGFLLRRRRILDGTTRAAGEVEFEFVEAKDVRSLYSNAEICDRRTDRRSYRRLPLSREDRMAIETIVSKYPGVALKSYSDSSRPSKRELEPELALLEKLRWQNGLLLEGLLNEIAFGAEIATTQDKLASDQLGVSRIEQFFLHALREWQFLRWSMRIGFHVLSVYRAISVFVRDCAEIHFLSISSDSPTSFEGIFDLGSCLQELWLELNRRGLSVQPLGLPLIALAHVTNPAKLQLKSREVTSMNGVIRRFRDKFGIDFELFTIGFRVGFPKNSNQKLAASHRRPVLISKIQS